VIDGRGWRSGAVVEQREMNQWVFKITKYSQELLDALDTLDRWPDKVRLMQRNWIGRSEGLLVRFALDPKTLPEDSTPAGESELKILPPGTTRCSAPSSAIAPDHPLAQAAAAKTQNSRSSSRRRSATAPRRKSSTQEKLGFDTGIKAIHPFDPDWKLPVCHQFRADGIRHRRDLRCPAHDQRDLDFVNKYGLGNTPVVCPPDVDPKTFVITDTAYDGDGRMINSRFLDGMTIEEAKAEVARRLESEVRGNMPVGERQISACATGASRGSAGRAARSCDPLPDMRCGAGAGQDLPVVLPEDVSFDKPATRSTTIRPGSTSAAAMRGKATRETDTMDTFVDLVVVLRALHRSLERERADDAGGGGPADAGRSVYRRRRARDPAPAVQPLLHPRDEGHRPYRHGRAVRRHVHAGHGGARDLPRRPTAAMSTPAEVKIDTGGNGKRAVLLTSGEDIHIGPIEKMSKSNATPSIRRHHRDLRRRRALVRCRIAAGPRRDLGDERVQGASRFVQRLWRLVNESAELANRARGTAGHVRPDALALRKAAHGALDKVPAASKSCISTSAWPI
jgi:leucyl-tRNA synthetase